MYDIIRFFLEITSFSRLAAENSSILHVYEFDDLANGIAKTVSL